MILYYIMLWYVMLCYIILNFVILYYVISNYFILLLYITPANSLDWILGTWGRAGIGRTGSGEGVCSLSSWENGKWVSWWKAHALSEVSIQHVNPLVLEPLTTNWLTLEICRLSIYIPRMPWDFCRIHGAIGLGERSFDARVCTNEDLPALQLMPHQMARSKLIKMDQKLHFFCGIWFRIHPPSGQQTAKPPLNKTSPGVPRRAPESTSSRKQTCVSICHSVAHVDATQAHSLMNIPAFFFAGWRPRCMQGICTGSSSYR